MQTNILCLFLFIYLSFVKSARFDQKSVIDRAEIYRQYGVDCYSWKFKGFPYVADITEQHWDGKVSTGLATLISDSWLIALPNSISESYNHTVRIGHSKDNYKVEKTVIHPDFKKVDDWRSDNQIGLIKLENPVTFDDKVQALPLASEHQKPGDKVNVVGYVGQFKSNEYISNCDRNYTMADITASKFPAGEVMDKKDCKEANEIIYKFYKYYNLNMYGPIYDQNLDILNYNLEGDKSGFCVKLYNNVEQLYCAGTLGGPLIIDGKLAGMKTSNQFAYPEAYIDIVHYLPWIKEITGIE